MLRAGALVLGNFTINANYQGWNFDKAREIVIFMTESKVPQHTQDLQLGLANTQVLYWQLPRLSKLAFSDFKYTCSLWCKFLEAHWVVSQKRKNPMTFETDFLRIQSNPYDLASFYRLIEWDFSTHTSPSVRVDIRCIWSFWKYLPLNVFTKIIRINITFRSCNKYNDISY